MPNEDEVATKIRSVDEAARTDQMDARSAVWWLALTVAEKRSVIIAALESHAEIQEPTKDNSGLQRMLLILILCVVVGLCLGWGAALLRPLFQ